jgi:5-methylthioadenosine/S-adenosylhomocysteine deaminase
MGGARCLDLDDQVGELRAGLQADLTVLSLEATHQLPVYDPVAATVFSSSASDVVCTVVAGQEIFRDGKVVGIDEQRLKARMQEISQKLK